MKKVFRSRSRSADGGDDLKIGVTAREVVLSKLLLIRRQLVGIVVVAAANESQDVGAPRLDDVAKPRLAESFVPNERETGDPGLRAVLNDEDEVHPIVR